MKDIPKVMIALFQAIRIGNELVNSKDWKNAQVIASLITAILGVAWAMGYRIDVLPDDILAIASAIAASVNAYLTIATSKKIGIRNKSSTSANQAEMIDLSDISKNWDEKK